MKLQQSKDALADAHVAFFTNEGHMAKWMEHVRTVTEIYKEQKKGEDKLHRRLRWDMWWALTKNVREDVILQSIPRKEWVGGYPDITDDNIDALLRHCWGEFVKQSVQNRNR